MDPEQFRQAGHRLIDWIADYRAHIADLPVRSTLQPGAVRSQLQTEPPLKAEGFDSIFRDLDRIIVPGLSHFQHPSFYGYFPANSELASVLGDYLSTGLGVLGLSWQSSPALTELEEVTTDWVRQMVGLSTAWNGVIQDTASTSTLVALLCAREHGSEFSLARGGLQGESQPLIVYVSSHSHSSVEKAALLAGFGRSNIHTVTVDEKYAMRPEALAEAIRADRDEGPDSLRYCRHRWHYYDHGTGSVGRDQRIARQENLWLHVDAAMAGSAMILPECRWMWEGIESAELARAERAQVARRGIRLLALLRARSAAPDPCDGHQPELSAKRGGQAG